MPSKRIPDNVVHALAAAALCAAAGAHAGNGDWDYEFSFYAWAKGIEGTSGDAEIDLDFQDDILDRIDSAFAGSLQAQRGSWTLYGALEYSDISDNARIEREFDFTVPPDGPDATITAGTRGELSLEELLVDAAVGWAFAENDSMRWELLGGAKLFDYETTFEFGDTAVTGPGGGQIPLKNRKRVIQEDWWHPFVGIALRAQLGDAWRLRARTDYGYEDSDNNSWLVEAALDWRFNDWGALTLGYTYLDIDYDSGGRQPYIYDVEQQGPSLGVIVNF